MKKIIEHLRNKPDHVKSRYVIVFSAIATAVVVVLWIVTNQLTKTPDDTIRTDGPVKVFTSIFKSGIDSSVKNYQNDKQNLDKTLAPAKPAAESAGAENSGSESVQE